MFYGMEDNSLAHDPVIFMLPKDCSRYELVAAIWIVVTALSNSGQIRKMGWNLLEQVGTLSVVELTRF